MRGYIADLQISSEITAQYDHYKWCNQIFNKHPTKNNLILLNEAVDKYEHSLNVHKPSKKELENYFEVQI
jgi:hypothetical protein